MKSQSNEAIDLPLPGAFLLKPSFSEDLRGSFSKFFTEGLLMSKGVEPRFSEEFISISKKGVLRGLHYQRGESSQGKLIWCPNGRLFDVIVDLRQSSPAFGKWSSTIISDQDLNALYIPRGFAHGFLALEEDTRMVYQADRPHSPQNERGIIYSDSKLGIPWPSIGKIILSEKDSKWPRFDGCEKFE